MIRKRMIISEFSSVAFHRLLGSFFDLATASYDC